MHIGVCHHFFHTFPMNSLAIIPARYSSTRLEGKPLALIAGHPMIEWVWRRSVAAVGRAVVATDDARIVDTVKRFGGEVVLTSNTHTSGTSRCIEALQKVEQNGGTRADVVINVQGDEPFVSAAHLRNLVEVFAEPAIDIATLVRPFKNGEDLSNPNWPKVVIGHSGRALYFSRSVIPYQRNAVNYPYLKHIGVYAFRAEMLRSRISDLAVSSLEQCEGLEQLGWLYHGLAIQTVSVSDEGISVDTPDDLLRAQRYAQENGLSPTTCL